jgi:hypothetical protein
MQINFANDNDSQMKNQVHEFRYRYRAEKAKPQCKRAIVEKDDGSFLR